MKSYASVFWILLGLIIISASDVLAVGKDIKATVVDRDGNRFEVSKFSYRDHDEIIFSVGAERKRLKFKEIKKIVFKGRREDEEQPLIVTLEKGEVISGTIPVVGPRPTGTFGTGSYGGSQEAFSGVTKLGKFLLPLRNTKEVIFHHEKLVKRCPVSGKIFDQEGYKFCPYHGVKLEEVPEVEEEQEEEKAQEGQVQ